MPGGLLCFTVEALGDGRDGRLPIAASRPVCPLQGLPGSQAAAGGSCRPEAGSGGLAFGGWGAGRRLACAGATTRRPARGSIANLKLFPGDGDRIRRAAGAHPAPAILTAPASKATAMPPSQATRSISVNTTLGPDVLLLASMTAAERLSAPFEYELALLSERIDIGADDLLGTPATVALLLPSGERRFFNGYINRFSHVGLRRDLCPVSRQSGALDLVFVAHRRLPDLSGQDGPGHRQGDLPRPWLHRLRGAALRQLSPMDLLRPVPRDRPVVRQSPARA